MLFFGIGSLYADNSPADVTKHLGERIPLNLTFVNSKGDSVLLRDLITKPTVIDFVYYQCAGICTPLMMELSDVVGKVASDPGKAYNMICISIDQNETPAMAAEKKHLMIGLCKKEVPDSAWMFLTGDSASIDTVTRAAGFGFERTYGGFIHKGVLIFVDKTGKIVQYLSPGYIQRTGDFAILPSEFELAVQKASTGTITSNISSILQSCRSYIPKGNSGIILLLIGISGPVTIIAVIVIIRRAKIPKKA